MLRRVVSKDNGLVSTSLTRTPQLTIRSWGPSAGLRVQDLCSHLLVAGLLHLSLLVPKRRRVKGILSVVAP